MKTTLVTALACSASFLVAATPSLAQDAQTPTDLWFIWEGELEIGVESVIDSNTAGNEIDDPYAKLEIVGEAALGDNLAFFFGITAEEMTGPSSGINDVGAYIHEIGLTLGTPIGDVTVGKFGPSFGAAWDETAGFFGGKLAEDYELTETLGLRFDTEIDGAGVLSLAVFYADNTQLSSSMFYNRGRNTTAAGGAGNTGELNNASLQWAQEIGDTRFLIGGRYLSAGTGDVSDETGFVAALGHTFQNGLDVYGEVASFDGYGGTADDATYATLNASYAIADYTALSGTYARRDVDSTGVTDLYSLALEREFGNGITLGGAIAFVDDAGVEDTVLGLNVVIPFGG